MSQTLHPIQFMFGSMVFGIDRSNGASFGSIKFKQGWGRGGENIVRSSFMYQHLENSTRYDQSYH